MEKMKDLELQISQTKITFEKQLQSERTLKIQVRQAIRPKLHQ